MTTEFGERPGYHDSVLWNMPSRPRRKKKDNSAGQELRRVFGRLGVPPLEEFEEGAAKSDVANTISRLHKELGISTVNYLGESMWSGEDNVAWSGEAAGEFTPIDRTLEIPLSDPKMYPVEMLRGIQQILIDRHPDWRVMLLGYPKKGEPVAVIYSDAIRLGDTLCPPIDLELATTEWQSTITQMRDATKGVEERRWHAAMQRVPALAAAAKENEAVLLAAFPNTKRGVSEIEVWLLLGRSQYDFDQSNDVIHSCRSIATVAATGEIFTGNYKRDPWWDVFEIHVLQPLPFDIELSVLPTSQIVRIHVDEQDVLRDPALFLKTE